MNDITALMATMKAAAEKATRGDWTVQFGDEIYAVDGVNNDQVAVATLDENDADHIALSNPVNVLALVEVLEKAQAELERYRTAFHEWSDKTEWVQKDKRFDVLKPWGKHRADVLKEYIEHLESRTVTVKLPRSFNREIFGDGMYEVPNGNWMHRKDVTEALQSAGIQVIEGEQKNG